MGRYFKAGASAAATEFCEWIEVRIDFNIRHRKHQVKPHLSCQISCLDTIIQRNHTFSLYQQNRSSPSKVKLRQASNRCKRDLKATRLAYANKTKESITSRLRKFWRFANSDLSKGKSVIPPLSSASDKAKLFDENL